MEDQDSISGKTYFEMGSPSGWKLIAVYYDRAELVDENGKRMDADKHITDLVRVFNSKRKRNWVLLQAEIKTTLNKECPTECLYATIMGRLYEISGETA